MSIGNLALPNFHPVSVEADIIDYLNNLVVSDDGKYLGNWLNQT